MVLSGYIALLFGYTTKKNWINKIFFCVYNGVRPVIRIIHRAEILSCFITLTVREESQVTDRHTTRAPPVIHNMFLGYSS